MQLHFNDRSISANDIILIYKYDVGELYIARMRCNAITYERVKDRRPAKDFLDILPNKQSLVYYKGAIYNTDTIDRIERCGNSNCINIYPTNLTGKSVTIDEDEGENKLTFDDFTIIGDMIAANNPYIVRIGNKYINVNSVIAAQKTGKKTFRYLYMTAEGFKGIKADDERSGEELFNLLNVHGTYTNHKGIFYNSENIESTSYRKDYEDTLIYIYNMDKSINHKLRDGYYSFNSKETMQSYRQFIKRLEETRKFGGTYSPRRKLKQIKLVKNK